MTQKLMRHWQQAEAALEAGDVATAAQAYGELTHVAEWAPHAHLRLSLMADSHRSLRDATRHAMQALEAVYPDPDLLCMLGKRLLTLGEYEPARTCAQALLQRTRPDAGQCAELGKLMSDHLEVDAALPLLESAAASGLGNSAALRYLLGLNAMYAGDLPRAHQELDRALRLEPRFHLAYWTAAKLGNEDGRSGRIDRLKALLAELADDHPDRAILGYSLFHELDAIDEVEQAWQALAIAMQRRRRQVRHDPDRDDALHVAIADAWRQPSFAPSAPTSSNDATPIFVLGMPRTGTTLVDRELSRVTGAVSAGELRDLLIQMRWLADLQGPWTLDAELLARCDGIALPQLGQRYLSHTQWRAGSARHYIDKWPDNYKLAGWISRAIPGARLVSVHRNPMDACFSNLKEWFAGIYGYSYDMHETARQYLRYERLMAAFHEARPQLSVRVRYEDLVTDPGHTMAALASNLALPTIKPSEGVPAVAVRTASAVQVRESIHRRGIGGWRRYAKYLAPMQDALSAAGIDSPDAMPAS